MPAQVIVSYYTPGTYTFTVPNYARRGGLYVTISGAGGGGSAGPDYGGGFGVNTSNAANGGTSSFAGSLIANGGQGAYGCPGSPTAYLTAQAAPILYVVNAVALGGTASGGTINITGSLGIQNSSHSGGPFPNDYFFTGPFQTASSYSAYAQVRTTSIPIFKPGSRSATVNPGFGYGGAGGITAAADPPSSGRAIAGGVGGAGGYATKTYAVGELTPGSTITIVVGQGGAAGA
jgi:hypothetical protein